jgi:hypothetical protein
LLVRQLLEQRFGRAAPKSDVEENLACSRVSLAGAHGVEDDSNLLVAGTRKPEPISDQPEPAMSLGDRAVRIVNASEGGEQA